MPTKKCSTRVVWRIKDGKPGHENQTRGLINALSKRRPIECVDFDVEESGISWFRYLTRARMHLYGSKMPDLVLGAGSRAHSTLLAAARQTGAPAIVLMTPPRGLSRFFDLCIVPEHDGRSGANFFHTQGALNAIEPSADKDPNCGLILVGGPSKHYAWESESVIRKISSILETSPAIQWTATTSRRSPQETADKLLSIKAPNFSFVPAGKTSPDWLPDQLQRAAYVWVSEDSVSMVYEALSSGAKVGLLAAPRKRDHSRVVRGIDQLIKEGRVLAQAPATADLTRFDQPVPFNEAERVARHIDKHFLRD